MTREIQPFQLRCYDNGGATLDRYTILPPRWAGKAWRHNPRLDPQAWTCIGASEHPYHPQGFGQHGSAHVGPHLGKRVGFYDLPIDVQRLARETFCNGGASGV